jgi:hypothetical protein
VFIIYSK